MTIAIALFDTDDQNVFLLCYGGGAVYLFARSKALDLKHNSRGVVRLLETSLLLYGGGFALWLMDRNFCSAVRSFYLHCFWHLGAGSGTFCGVLFWMWVRYECLGMKPRLCGNPAIPAGRWVEVSGKLV
eukprot:TRINITY_DN60843_c0_g1_i1.p2 TRINITY_DN60843_c0_g1~~TRINITY_DN60843_c0_g1_i1.p2  ORF type:complete len:129 (-),score=21.08 TRINITY_DN60843_c0_g1_i1:30-416(-)